MEVYVYLSQRPVICVSVLVTGLKEQIVNTTSNLVLLIRVLMEVSNSGRDLSLMHSSVCGMLYKTYDILYNTCRAYIYILHTHTMYSTFLHGYSFV